MGTPEAMEASGFNLRLLWAGRVPQSQLLSCHPPTQAQGWEHVVAMGVTNWPGLPEAVPGKLCWHLSPMSQETPRSRQTWDSWSPEGEKPSLMLSPVLCPHLGMLSFCQRFLQIIPFCVCHLFLRRAPADTPGASEGWTGFRSPRL